MIKALVFSGNVLALGLMVSAIVICIPMLAITIRTLAGLP